MESKKLINILVKDMQELEGLISDIKTKGTFNEFEFEFLHARAKGLLSLIGLLNNQEEIALPIQKEKKAMPETAKEEEKTEIEAPEVEQGINIKEEKVEEVKQENSEEKSNVEKAGNLDEVPLAAPNNQNIDEAASEDNEGAMEVGEMEEEKTPTTLGESFASEKSLNDLISETQKNAQTSISNMPVSSLQSAVGINDRFLFTRELFNGDPDLYANAINNLDKMGSIQDAVSYLRDNYKWKKNETSLKFIDLVKRRFANG